MNKKLINGLVALSILLGTSTSALATNSGKTEAKEVTGTGNVNTAIIDVEIPTELSFKIDPFNIEKEGKVTTAALKILNKSNVPVEIKMSELKGTPSSTGELNLVDTPAAVTTEGDTKDAFLWMGQVSVTTDKNDPNKEIVKPLAAFSESKNGKQVIKTEKGTDVISMGSLVEAVYNGSEFSEISSKGQLNLGIMGDVRSIDGWTEDDSVEVSATFSVEPKVVGTVK